MSGTSQNSPSPDLVDYWVSGVDGSYPDLQPEQLTEFYSVGRTKSFVGDIMQPGVAADAFRRCSYKKEIIMMCTDVGDIWFEFVFSQIMMMSERGYAHVVVFMDSKNHCDQLQTYAYRSRYCFVSRLDFLQLIVHHCR
jgi:hypothetical protein